MMTDYESVEAPRFPGESRSRQQGQRIAAPGEARARHAVLLSGELEKSAIVHTTAIIAAIEIGLFVAGRDVGTRVRIGVLDPPAAHVDAQLARTALDAQMLECPELNARQVEHSTGFVIEIVDLDAVVENSNAIEPVVVGCGLWRRQPAGAKRGDPGNAIEQIDHRQRSGREKLSAIPLVLRADLIENRIRKSTHWRLDGVGFHLGTIRSRISFRLNWDRNFTGRRLHHLR